MISRSRLVLIPALLSIAVAAPGRASLLGTSVTGSLEFQGHPLNYFDPANGFVLATGYENSSGTTVTIAEPAIEFGAVFPANTDTANFTASQLILTDVVNSTGPNIPFTISFVDPAFFGLGLSKLSDTFANGGTTASLTGDTLTVAWDGGLVNPGTLQAVYNLSSSTPEPASLALFIAGAVAMLSRLSLAAFVKRL